MDASLREWGGRVGSSKLFVLVAAAFGVEATQGTVKLASATFHLVEAPTLRVALTQPERPAS
ncbi:MAG: hypothetical protein IPK85_00970 [Gemmatimonadetes bacterium]|nr:hypothetical protein [Gemmatimonadota bacterium]